MKEATCERCGKKVVVGWCTEMFSGSGKIYYCDECMREIGGKIKGSHYLRTKKVQRERREKYE